MENINNNNLNCNNINNNDNNNNSLNNNSNHELSFWKVFRNIYIRNFLLSQLSNNNKSYYDYNGTTSLEFMLNHNKLDMIIDKLKSNHFIHLNKIQNIYNKITESQKLQLNEQIKYIINPFESPSKLSIPCDPSIKFKLEEIHRLLFLKYGHIIKRQNPLDDASKDSLDQLFFINSYNYLYNSNNNQINNNNSNNQINNTNNKFNNYYAHSLLYSILNNKNLNNNNKIIELIKYFYSLINDNNNNNSNLYDHINKKQRTSDNPVSSSSTSSPTSSSTSSSNSSSTSSSSKPLTPEEEIKNTIYNNQPIPFNINDYFIAQRFFINVDDSNKDSNEDYMKLDIGLFLEKSKGKLKVYNCSNDNKILEAIVSKLLDCKDTVIELWYYSGEKNGKIKTCSRLDYQFNNVMHAKIYCLNVINQNYIENCGVNDGLDKCSLFKNHLIDNQVNTLQELISVSRDLLIDGIYGKKNEYYYFGDFFNYYLLYSKQFHKIKIEKQIYINDKRRRSDDILTEKINNYIFSLSGSKNNNNFNGLGDEDLEDDDSDLGYEQHNDYDDNYVDITAKIQDSFSLLLSYSVIKQSFQVFDILKNNIVFYGHFQCKIKQVDSVAKEFNSDESELIKSKSTKYFNYIFEQINRLLFTENSEFTTKKMLVWYSIFKIIINNYNSKLFQWLLESNKNIKEIYYEMLCDEHYCLKLLNTQTKVFGQPDQLNSEMFDIFIYHYQFVHFKKEKLKLKSFQGPNNKSYPRFIKLLNHITKSVSSTQTNNNIYRNIIMANGIGSIFIEILVKKLILGCIGNLENLDDIIKVYNQIDQESLSNYFIITSANQQMSQNILKAFRNKSTVLINSLLNSVINLDFDSIIKIVSATINNNGVNDGDGSIDIPRSINNSLDIIEYLIKNNYLKEFSIDYLLLQVKNKIKVDKEYIMKLLKLSSNSIVTSTNTNNNNDLWFVSTLFKETGKDFNFKNPDFSLERLEKLRSKRNNGGKNNNYNSEQDIKRMFDQNMINSLRSIGGLGNGINLFEVFNDSNNSLFGRNSKSSGIRSNNRIFKNRSNHFRKEDKHLDMEDGEIIYHYFENGYYNSIYQFLNDNHYDYEFISNIKEIFFSKIEPNYFIEHPISIHHFSRLYPLLFERFIRPAKKLKSYSPYEVYEFCYFNTEIFEFLWQHHLDDDYKKREFILATLFTLKTSPSSKNRVNETFKCPKYHQFIEYLLENKREFISKSSKLTLDQIKQLFKNTLIYGNTQMFHKARLLFPSYNFDINFFILKKLIQSPKKVTALGEDDDDNDDFFFFSHGMNHNNYVADVGNRYDAIEYLYENNLIPNLNQIISNYKLIIKEYNNEIYKNHSKSDVIVSKSMFILIHSIINLQQPQKQ